MHSTVGKYNFSLGFSWHLVFEIETETDKRPYVAFGGEGNTMSGWMSASPPFVIVVVQLPMTSTVWAWGLKGLITEHAVYLTFWSIWLSALLVFGVVALPMAYLFVVYIAEFLYWCFINLLIFVVYVCVFAAWWITLVDGNAFVRHPCCKECDLFSDALRLHEKWRMWPFLWCVISTRKGTNTGLFI